MSSLKTFLPKSPMKFVETLKNRSLIRNTGAGLLIVFIICSVFVSSIYFLQDSHIHSICPPTQCPARFISGKVKELKIILPLYAFFGAIIFFILQSQKSRIEQICCRLDTNGKFKILVLFLTTFLITAFFGYFVLQRFPNSADEYAYIFQAETYLKARIWNQIHPLQEYFSFTFIAEKEGKWLSIFNPGWPIILTIFKKLYFPYWIVNAIISGISISVLYIITNRLFGNRAADVTTITVLFSSFFIFNGASLFPHMLTFLLLLLFFYFGLLATKNFRSNLGILAGIFIGFAFITRPYTSFLIGILYFFYLFFFIRDRNLHKKIKLLVTIFLGATPLILLFLYYNYLITGDPLMMVSTWFDQRQAIGFVYGHNLLKGLFFTYIHLMDLISWSSPLVLLLFPLAIILAVRLKHSWAFIFLSAFMIIVFGHILYFSFGGNQYGPRFYFEGFTFAVLGITAIIFGEEITIPYRDTLRNLFMTGIILALLTIPIHANKEYNVIEERMDLYNLVENENIQNAVVVLRNGTGVTRLMPVRDLTRNGVDLTNDVLYVKDLGEEKLELLLNYFPDRRIYLYNREENEVHGTLDLLK